MGENYQQTHTSCFCIPIVVQLLASMQNPMSSTSCMVKVLLMELHPAMLKVV